MAQISVYLPDAFAEHLNRHRSLINVSAVCQKALVEALLEAMERDALAKDPAPVWALGAL